MRVRVYAKRPGKCPACSDLEGLPLTPPNTKRFVEEIERLIAKGYLDAMKTRTKIPQGEDGWLSLGAFNESEKYVRLYIRPVMGKIKLNELRRADVMGFLANRKVVQTGERASRRGGRKKR